MTDLNIPQRILLGPGPSMVHPRVMRALTAPVIGYMDSHFLAAMDDVRALLDQVFEAGDGAFSMAISGTGSAGMEASVVNFVEPGDEVLVCVIGFFGGRIAEMYRRYGANVHTLEADWGDAVTAQQVEEALQSHPAKIVAAVHGETSTGVEQPLAEIAAVAHRHGALFLVDTVASLAGVKVGTGETDIDICYSGSQKCLSAPPGLAPLTVSPRAWEVLEKRQTPVTSWYLDLTLLRKYWDGETRSYHHTAPMNLNYALREALQLIVEEGLAASFARHSNNAQLLWDGLAALDLMPFVPESLRLPSLTTVRLPDGLDEANVRRRLMDEYNIEIAGGLGALAGRVWRIGLTGHSCRLENVVMLLGALERLL